MLDSPWLKWTLTGCTAMGMGGFILKQWEALVATMTPDAVLEIIAIVGCFSLAALMHLRHIQRRLAEDKRSLYKMGMEAGRKALMDAQLTQAPTEVIEILGALRMAGAFDGKDFEHIFASVGVLLQARQDDEFRRIVGTIRRARITLNQFPGQKERFNALLGLYGLEKIP